MRMHPFNHKATGVTGEITRFQDNPEFLRIFIEEPKSHSLDKFLKFLLPLSLFDTHTHTHILNLHISFF